MSERQPTYNWSAHKGPTSPVRQPVNPIEIDDETLRDGLQGIQLESHPSLEKKRIYLQWASKFVDHADIGFPGSDERHQNEITQLVRFVQEKNIGLTLSAAARAAVKTDIEPIIQISHELDGYLLEADIFLDGSSLRADIEGWDRKEKLNQLVENIKLLKNHGLPIMFVAERATSTSPCELAEIFNIAADLGVDRLCIADTQGRADHTAISNIVRWSLNEFSTKFPHLKWDAHFHNDLGLGVSNCLIASEEGINRVHATSFCIGERSGNVDLATLLVNLNLSGYRMKELKELNIFSKIASELLAFPISSNAPIIGSSSFATGSGVHSSTLRKEALENGHIGIYFPYSPADVGAAPEVKIGPFSGASNVYIVLEKLGYKPTEAIVKAILEEAKSQRGILSEPIITGIVHRLANGKISKI